MFVWLCLNLGLSKYLLCICLWCLGLDLGVYACIYFFYRVFKGLKVLVLRFYRGLGSAEVVYSVSICL